MQYLGNFGDIFHDFGIENYKTLINWFDIAQWVFTKNLLERFLTYYFFYLVYVAFGLMCISHGLMAVQLGSDGKC